MPRNEFIVQDLAISIRPETGFAAGGGGTYLPADDGTPLPPWLSPIAAVLIELDQIEIVSRSVLEAVEQKRDPSGIAGAFAGISRGDAAIADSLRDIGAAVVASAVARSGAEVGLIDPEHCSTEGFPPTITPVIHRGREIHAVRELPALREQLAVAVKALDGAADRLQPRGEEVPVVAKHLEGALESLRTRVG